MSEKPNSIDPTKQVASLVEKAVGTVEGALGEPVTVEGGEVTPPTRPLSVHEHKDLSNTMNALHIALFAEKVANSEGKTLTHIIPLTEDGRINKFEAERALHKAGQLDPNPEKGGQSLIQYLQQVNPDTPDESGPFTVENLKRAAALISENHPEVTFEFIEEPSSVTYTARFN